MGCKINCYLHDVDLNRIHTLETVGCSTKQLFIDYLMKNGQALKTVGLLFSGFVKERLEIAGFNINSFYWLLVEEWSGTKNSGV